MSDHPDVAFTKKIETRTKNLPSGAIGAFAAAGIGGGKFPFFFLSRKSFQDAIQKKKRNYLMVEQVAPF